LLNNELWKKNLSSTKAIVACSCKMWWQTIFWKYPAHDNQAYGLDSCNDGVDCMVKQNLCYKHIFYWWTTYWNNHRMLLIKHYSAFVCDMLLFCWTMDYFHSLFQSIHQWVAEIHSQSQQALYGCSFFRHILALEISCTWRKLRY
jgi:hypothetical protein